MPNSVIAIDGPSASGKSTVARRVAAALRCLYVDSGSLYRAVTWQAMKNGIDTADPAALASLLHGFPIDFFILNGAVAFRIDGVEPGMELRTESLNSHVSQVAATPAVRSKVNEWLRGMTNLGSLVVEGRDIGTAVFQNAAFKFYLDASPEERAKRRFSEMEQAKETITRGGVGESLRKRDTIDSTRKTDPLRIAADATVVDSTSMTIDQVVGQILEKINKNGKWKGNNEA